MKFFYRERPPDGPFATLIAVAATYRHPEACADGYADLVSRTRSPQAGNDEIGVFMAELQHALAYPGRLPGDELSRCGRIQRRQRRGLPAPPVARPVLRRTHPRNGGAVNRSQREPARRSARAGPGGPARTRAGRQ